LIDFRQGHEIRSLFQSFQTGSVAHLASYSMDFQQDFFGG
jgi:hypothetical protein